MKTIQDHLASIIIALAAIMLLVGVILCFTTPVGDFFSGIFQKQNEVANGDIWELGNFTPDGAGGGSGGGGMPDETITYMYLDTIQRGQYEYTYMGCESYDEYAIGALKGILRAYGIQCTTREEVLNNAAVMMGCSSFAEMGMTETEFFEAVGVTEDAYNYVKLNGVEMFQGWMVRVVDNTLAEYDPIPNQIDGIPVLSANGTFTYCVNMTTAPTIPAGVTNMESTFYGCTSLTGDIEINANPAIYDNCFYGTTQSITITGSCSNATKAALAGTANNGNVSY